MTKDTTAATQPDSEPGMFGAVAAVLYLMYIVLTAMERYSRGVVDVPDLIGAILGPVIITIVIIAIARLFKRATSQRGAAKVAVGSLALFVLGSCGGLLTAVSATQRAPAEAAARLAKGAVAAAGRVPKRVDKVTWLNGVESHGDTLVYYYQLLMTPEEWAQSSVHEFRTQLIAKVCGNTTLRSESVSQGVVIRYRYADLNDKDLASVYVTEAVCSSVGTSA